MVLLNINKFSNYMINEAGLQDITITPALFDDEKYIQQLIDIINKTPKEDYKNAEVANKIYHIILAALGAPALFIPGTQAIGIVSLITTLISYITTTNLGLNDIKRVNILIDRSIKKLEKQNTLNPSRETEKVIKKLKSNKEKFNNSIKNDYFDKQLKKQKNESAIYEYDDIFSNINII